ncbi:MAG: hypothetical protein RLY31_2122 [Bacteroidota bacterium]|jgi:predicted O-methyltransferase YrrM
MTNEKIEQAILELEDLDKQGESYSDTSGRFGWRNPIREDTGGLLRSLVIASGARRVLEIGTGHGLSTLYLVTGLPEGVGATVETVEFDPAVASSTQARMDATGSPVRVHQGDALAVIGRLEGTFDLVFLDAQKNQYLDYLQALIRQGSIGPGTVVLADNVIDRKEECLPFLSWFERQSVPHHIIPTSCGLLVARL